jgi:ribonucleoside-diphosphate reductase alpha chain
MLEINGHEAEKVKTYDEKLIDELVRLSPYHNATANDVNWLMKVKMQGAIQKWVDHSISVTVNLPSNVNEELVSQVYMTAWESGCKGVTVYRDGSRSGVLINKKDEGDKEKLFINAKKRPKALEADVIKFSNNNGKWIAFVGILDGKPYEIFTGMEDEEVFYIPKKITNGYIIKSVDEEGNKRYDFQYKDRHGFKTTFEGLSRLFDKEYWNYAKLISSVLRYGMPIPDVVNLVGSLQLDNENINTWKNGVERALKKYIPNGTKAKQGMVCEKCGTDALVYEEGCLNCKNCGHSKCG